VKLYLDSSAVVKLIQREAESAALRRYLRRLGDDLKVTSALARVEVLRALAAGGPTAVAHTRRVLSGFYQVDLSRSLLDDAAMLAPGTILRSLDAIHLATARAVGPDLRAVVTYDERMKTAAAGLGLLTEAPA
jgi:hypothetical protein